MTEPRPDEFRRFHDLLTEHAPDGYEPWYFRCESGSKAPDLSYGSWKDKSARLSVEDAIDWMKQGGNVGIAGTDNDALVNVDIDDEDETTPGDLKETLIARSRSRTGVHAWYFAAPGEEIPNIPTDDAGEVRANWQYVVAPGSYVETDSDTVPDDEQEDAGYYTVEWDKPVNSLRFDELPAVFREHHNQSEQEEKEPELGDDLPDENNDTDNNSRKSALFDITAKDVVRKEGGNTDTGDRWSSLWHGSDTDANMSLSNKGRIQCWRHNVAHGGLQALAVLSDYQGTCEKVGTGHKGSNAGSSCFNTEDGAHVWHAWKYAKKNGYLPDDDPVPYSAIRHLCRERDLCAVTEIPDDPDDGSIPGHAYDMALKTIENKDGLSPGRKPTAEIESTKQNADSTHSEPPEKNEDGNDGKTSWADVRQKYADAAQIKEIKKGPARQAAQEVLEREFDWMFVKESERLWVYDENSGTFNEWGESTVGRTLVNELGQHYTRTEKGELTDRLSQLNAIHREQLNARARDEPLVCVGNGVVNLQTGELYDHSPEFRFVRGLEWDYPTEENGLTADRETLLEFLDDVTERKADRNTLLDHLAHGLMPGHPYRAFVVCYGPGGNGKTQVAKLFRQFAGGEQNAASVEIDDLVNDDFATSDLVGKFINWGDDMSGDGGGTLQDLSTLKKASGGSSIRANEKYEKTFDFKNQAAMFFSANEPPRIGEEKPSVMDRLYPIEMPYRYLDPDSDEYDEDNPLHKKKIPNYAETLIEDEAVMRALLELAVEHAQDLVDRRGEYSQPESPKERFNRYNQEADPIVRFSNTAFEEASASLHVRKDDAYLIYQSFTDTWQERTAAERGFKRQLPRKIKNDVEAAKSRALATEDDDSDRVPTWKRLTWTEAAREHMPEWMVERYNDHWDDVEETEQKDNNSRDTLLDVGTGMYQGPVEATIAEKGDPPDWLEGKGYLVDGEGGIMPYIVEAGDPLDVEEGDTATIENVKVEERKGVETAVLSGITEITVSESTPSADGDVTAAADGGSLEPQSDAESGDEETETAERPVVDYISVPTDAEGTEPNAQRIAQYVDRKGPTPETVLRKTLTLDIDLMSPEEFNTALEKGIEEYGLMQRRDGKIESML